MSKQAEITNAVVSALNLAADSPSNSLQRKDVGKVAKIVIEQVAPSVLHANNQEPWYQSRVTWGAIIAVGASIAGIAGYSVGLEDQAAIVNGAVAITSGIGGLIVWYGRWRARKPIGS